MHQRTVRGFKQEFRRIYAQFAEDLGVANMAVENFE